jgi:hypothetical protein
MKQKRYIRFIFLYLIVSIKESYFKRGGCFFCIKNAFIYVIITTVSALIKFFFQKKQIKMIRKIILLIIAILSINNLNCLKPGEICYKEYECNGKQCSLLNCTGLLNYDCDRHECSLDAETCDQYLLMKSEIDSRKNSKLDRAFTVALIKGISFASRRLKKYEFIIRHVRICL